MAFRADEAARIGFEEAVEYLVPRARDVDDVQRKRSREFLRGLADEIGPVVTTYPTWHPLVCNHNPRDPVTLPDSRCGYAGLDHSRFFAHGFITCPYGDGQDVLDSVANLPRSRVACVSARRLDECLYSPRSTPILVTCEWVEELEDSGVIPLRLAMPLLLEQELACWRWAEIAETWETMRPYFLGRPHGSRSSLFVSQETGQSIKKIWNDLIRTGMFGPIRT